MLLLPDNLASVWPYFVPLQAWLKTQESDMLALVMHWSALNSGSNHLIGLDKQCAALEQAFASLNGEISQIALPPATIINEQGDTSLTPLGPLLSIEKRTAARKSVLLSGHMDTVFGATHSFQTPIQESATRLYGPGVADMKGGLVILLYALRAFEQSDIAKNLGWQVLISSDEEIGSIGSAKHLAQAAKNHDLGIVFEPSLDQTGAIAAARKGSAYVTITIHGKSAHVGRDFALGQNAILPLGELIPQLHALNGQRDGAIIHIGHVQAGVVMNRVPDIAVLQLNIRAKQDQDFVWADKNIAGIVAQVANTSGYKIDYSYQLVRPPKPMLPDTEKLYSVVKNLAKSLDQNMTWFDTGGVSDANNLQVAGLLTLDSMGAIGGGLHTEQEFIEIPSLLQRAELITLILLTMAMGES